MRSNLTGTLAVIGSFTKNRVSLFRQRGVGNTNLRWVRSTWHPARRSEVHRADWKLGGIDVLMDFSVYGAPGPAQLFGAAVVVEKNEKNFDYTRFCFCSWNLGRKCISTLKHPALHFIQTCSFNLGLLAKLWCQTVQGHNMLCKTRLPPKQNYK